MDIKPNEVESIKVIGELNGQSVKLIKTLGGFYAAVGARSKSSKVVEPLAAGSHPALVSHQIEKEFKKDYQPTIMKSESETFPSVKEFTKKLPKEMVDAGYQVYSLTKNNDINFIATKNGAEMINLAGYVTSNVINELTKVTCKTPAKETQKICAVIAEEING